MRGRVGRQLHFKREERLCQIVESVLMLERGGASPTIAAIAKEIGMRPSTLVRSMVNDLAQVGMFSKIETKHWNGAQKFVYKINPRYQEIPDLQSFAAICAGYGYRIPLSGFSSPITHDKDTSE